METMTQTTAPTTATETPAFGTVETCLKAYTVISTIALAATGAAAVTGHTVNTFMWIRAILLPIIAVALYRKTIAASRGSFEAFDKVRKLSLIMPIAIIGVELIPGVCPLWYAAAQALCMIPVIAAAVTTRGAALRAAFAKPAKTKTR
jgi:hypothetical protein